RREEAAHEQQLDERRQQGAGEDRGRQGEPVGQPVVAEELPEQHVAHDPHAAVSEIDDAAGAVNDDQAHGEHGVEATEQQRLGQQRGNASRAVQLPPHHSRAGAQHGDEGEDHEASALQRLPASCGHHAVTAPWISCPSWLTTAVVFGSGVGTATGESAGARSTVTVRSARSMRLRVWRMRTVNRRRRPPLSTHVSAWNTWPPMALARNILSRSRRTLSGRWRSILSRLTFIVLCTVCTPSIVSVPCWRMLPVRVPRISRSNTMGLMAKLPAALVLSRLGSDE